MGVGAQRQSTGTESQVNPGGSTFLSCPKPYSEVYGRTVMAQLVSLWTEESSPSEFNRCDISH